MATLLNRLAKKLDLLSERNDCRHCNPDIFLYRDCFETIRELSKFIKPEYLLDVGANAGNWTYVMHQLNPGLKHVVFFEPQANLIKKLKSLELNGVEKIIYGCGLGDKEDKLTLKGGTPSASFLDATRNQTDYFPGSLQNGKEEVRIEILDEIYSKDNLPIPDVIKLDVQGFELNVLKGAISVLSKTKYLVIELSFRDFYAGQPPIWKVLQFLEQQHYMMIAHGYEWKSKGSHGELLQMDGIFVNASLIEKDA